MKTLLLVIFLLCFGLSVAALSPDARNLTPRKTQAVAGARLTTIMGTIQEDGDKLRFVTDKRSWSVDNPEIIRVMKTLRARDALPLPGDKFNSHHRSEVAHPN
jgi:hypothetical protein